MVYKWYDIPANWGMDYATYLPSFRGTRFPTIDPLIYTTWKVRRRATPMYVLVYWLAPYTFIHRTWEWCCAIDPFTTVYLPIHEWLILMVNVGKYTIHGSFGNGSIDLLPMWGCELFFNNGKNHTRRTKANRVVKRKKPLGEGEATEGTEALHTTFWPSIILVGL